ncbi:MAG: DsbA family protein [Patescibacteria group bacterium]
MNGKTLFGLVLLLIVLLAGSVYTQGFSNLPLGSSSADQLDLSSDKIEEVKEKTTKLISARLVAPGTEFEITDVSAEEGLYKVTVDVNGQEVESFMKPDYSYFFPNPIEMDEFAAEQTGEDQQEQQTQDIPKSDNPEVQLFTMSYCPYGNQAEDLMEPVVDLLGDSITVEPHYIFYDNYQGGGPEYCMDEESKYCSMHGVEEANQDIRELCVYNNQQDKYWDFIANANEDCTVDNIETCWKDAARGAGVSVASVESCFEQNYLDYAEEEQVLTDELSVSGSPTLFINGVRYQDQSSRSAEAYKTAICEAFNNPPEECKQTLGDEAAPAGGC